LLRGGATGKCDRTRERGPPSDRIAELATPFGLARSVLRAWESLDPCILPAEWQQELYPGLDTQASEKLPYYGQPEQPTYLDRQFVALHVDS